MYAGNRQPRAARAPRFNLQALRTLAGDSVFARCEEYVRAGRVELLSRDGDRIVGQVMGSEIYRIELRGQGSAISGRCSCPAFENGFCKHLVAAALTVNAEAGSGEKMPDRLGTIREHLRSQGADRLVEMILHLAERDPALLGRLDLAASAASGDPEDVAERCRKALHRALRTGRYVDYAHAGSWVQGVLQVLDRMELLIGAGHAVLLLRLLDDAFPRIARALEQVDDSDGGGTEILERAAALHLAACHAVRPDPVALARDLFERETEDEFGTFRGASLSYADVLGPKGLAEYRRLAQSAWDRLGPGRRMVGRVMVMDRDGVARYQLFGILDSFAARDGDIETRIALRATDLLRAQDYLRLAEFCLEHGRAAEALRWAEEGAWLFDDDPSAERLLLFLAGRYRVVDRAPEAETALWRGFERRPSMELYRCIAETASREAEARVVAADRAVALLEDRIAATKSGAHAFVPVGLADLLLEILILERRLPEAWTASRRHRCSDPQLLRLAQASESACPDDALQTYAAVAERQIALANKGGYGEACRLIKRMEVLRTTAGDKEAHRAYVAEILERHRAKRSFVAMLAEATASGEEIPNRGSARRSTQRGAWMKVR
ncbi:DUF6880 family protein [Roseomonas sp. CAU 1739]|uniref:SWIM zinc finger family protein n=1 Tax=Roseomonas sp. CAU 1739 TaxID=3140364 RepID=UPI00325AC2F6